MSKIQNGDTKIIVDLINSRINRLEDKLTDKVHDHCIRIKALEKLRNMGAGGIIVIGIIYSVIKLLI